MLRAILNFLGALFGRKTHSDDVAGMTPPLNALAGTAQTATTHDISHSFVLPDRNFNQWLAAIQPYLQHFGRVAVIRDVGGNDLNRFRNVTAVQAPSMWVNDDALTHIRRVYPMVVKVDLIRVDTPQKLADILAQRIAQDDRFGVLTGEGKHIFERFILHWPSDYRPARIVSGFSRDPNARSIGISIASERGAKVLAAATGAVVKVVLDGDALGIGPYVRTSTVFDGVQYVITYGGLRNIRVSPGEAVKYGDKLAEAGGDSWKLIVQKIGVGSSGQRVHDVIDPVPLIYWYGLRVRPVDDGLRIRSVASTDGKIITKVGRFDLLEPLETHGRTLLRVGKQDQWLRVRVEGNKTGYAAAWFLEAADKIPTSVFDGVNPLGVNLDMFHQLGAPDPARLGNLGWVRLPYNISANVGSEDTDAAFQRFNPYLQALAQAGKRVILVLAHQTYGEGKFVWNRMSADDWARLRSGYMRILSIIVQQYAGRGLVHAWQIWNEQDAEIGAEASVALPPHEYGLLLAEAIQTIRQFDKTTPIITGGLMSGVGRGVPYMRAALSAMPAGVRPDGIAFHAYGTGARNNPLYKPFGNIGAAIEGFGAVMPSAPLWITEWGVINLPHEKPTDVASYALDFIREVKLGYGERVAALVWYAWAQGMHTGYGLVDERNQPRPGLTEQFLRA